jgi:putative Holliday junction resolvase
MAVDYGDARTGVAISDPDGILAGEAFVIKEWNTGRLAKKLNDIAKQRSVELVVLGLPVNMDGSLGPRAEKSEELSKILKERFGLDVVFVDERRTTYESHRILSEAGRRGKKRKERVDAVAASLILETYLNGIRRNKKPGDE